MAQTNAQRVQAHRVRQRQKIADLTREVGSLTARVTELAGLLEASEAECESLRASQCRHPSQVVHGGTCRACGTEVW